MVQVFSWIINTFNAKIRTHYRPFTQRVTHAFAHACSSNWIDRVTQSHGEAELKSAIAITSIVGTIKWT